MNRAEIIFGFIIPIILVIVFVAIIIKTYKAYIYIKAHEDESKGELFFPAVMYSIITIFYFVATITYWMQKYWDSILMWFLTEI